MKLRLGQDVHSIDGPFGELGDIIVDPTNKTVTNIIVEPHHRHRQARLVPMWLVTEAAGVISIGLDANHVRQLQPVAYRNFIKLGEKIDLGDGWDIGTQSVLAAPYYETNFNMSWNDESVDVAYDRIPKGDCEIGRMSTVVTVDDKTIGTVRGLLADDEHIKAVIVRSGVPGFRHDVLVPLGSVAAVRMDEIDLVLTEEQFASLPRTDIFGDVDKGLEAHVVDLRQRVETASHRVSDAGRSLATSAKKRLGNH